MAVHHDEKSWNTQFPVFILDRGELQAYLSDREVDQLTDDDLAHIAVILKQELEELGFFEQIIFIAKTTLAQKQRQTNGA